MASIAAREQATPSAAMRRALFIATICTGSFLLFLVQPMVARMALPRLGGAPAVWNSAMLVYQALLLGGYAYAHWLGRLTPRAQGSVHLALLTLAALTLPIGLVAGDPPVGASPIFWVPWLFACSIGPLFLAIAAQAPLMQRWYVASTGGDPYPLYAASNLGSFAGLIAYPLLVEPLMPVAGQSRMWSAGYGLLITLVLLCAFALLRGAGRAERSVAQGPAPTRARMMQWILLAAIPSALMLSTSLHLTTDIVAMPLLWVVPLGLYLLSFSVAFAARRGFAEQMRALAPLFLVASALAMFTESTPAPLLIAALVLLSLFVVATAIHAQMFDLRPEPAHLTRFYLCMSAGGVLGGIACALVAPLVFDWTYEHPLVLLAAAAIVRREPVFAGAGRFWTPRAMAAAMLLCLALSLAGQSASYALKLAGALAIAAVAILAIGRPLFFTGLLACLGLSMGGWDKLSLSATPGAMVRSYFGVYAVRSEDGARLLVHGTTVHGIQQLAPAKRRWPTSYYAPLGGAGLALQGVPRLFGPNARIGIVGLGAGTLACYRQPGQDWRFYEIDPAIARIATDRRAFTFLADCAPTAPIAIGDARLVLAREARQPKLDLLAIDAFSSDSVPMHLLTRETFALYGRRLEHSGLLLVHISNRFLDLEPVLAAAAQAGSWQAARRFYLPGPESAGRHYMPSLWIALSRDPATIARLKAEKPGAWSPLPAEPGFPVWSDDHASILGILKIFR